MKTVSAKEHYELLIQEGHDPVNDPPALQEHMDKWDGQAFIDALVLHPDSRVLEIGVGTGRLAKKVLKAGCEHFTGIDISPATIARAKANLSLWRNVYLVQGDFLTYQSPQVFDTVYCSLALFHFKDKTAFIRKVAELLHAKGRFVLSIPKVKEYAIHYGDRVVELYPDDADTLTPLLAGAGLAVRRITDVAFAHILVAQKAY